MFNDPAFQYEIEQRRRDMAAREREVRLLAALKGEGAGQSAKPSLRRRLFSRTQAEQSAYHYGPPDAETA